MVTTQKSGSKKRSKSKLKAAGIANLDLDPDAWPKFEELVKSAAKMGPKPHGEKGVTKQKKVRA